jgi:hypothetical protein
MAVTVRSIDTAKATVAVTWSDGEQTTLHMADEFLFGANAAKQLARELKRVDKDRTKNKGPATTASAVNTELAKPDV